jgi:molecular chaperone GrpE
MNKKDEHQEDVDMSYDVSHNDDVVFEDEGSEDTAEERVAKLKAKLKVCLTERQEYLEGWQRTRADFVNARKEEESRRGDLKKFAQAEFIEELLPVLDSFDMAFANKTVWEQVNKEWRDGITFIHSQLTSVLTQHGVTILDPMGQKFDPLQHSPLEVVPTQVPEEDDRIAAVLQKGYMMGNKVIRPAKVKVFSLNS